ncbi:MAG: trehalose-phosphatase [Hyphomonadaceae bacterium]
MKSDGAASQTLAAHSVALDLTRDALFLDLDGTLSPFAPAPEAVPFDPALSRLLAQISARARNALAIISGRTIRDVDRIVGGAVRCVAGVHGLERRAADGAIERAPPHPNLAAARAALGTHSGGGVEIEDKNLSVAVHFRRAPEKSAELRDAAVRIARANGLTVQFGHMVAEVRSPGPSKGDALRAYMRSPPFSGRRPIFVGDDLTDEHAFDAAALAGGLGVLVGPARDTRATARLADVAAVRAWLRRHAEEGQ